MAAISAAAILTLSHEQPPCKLADVLSVVEAFALAERLHDELIYAAEDSLHRLASALDPRLPVRVVTALQGQLAAGSATREEEPRVLAATSSLLALWKPPGWLVSVEDAGGEAARAEGAPRPSRSGGGGQGAGGVPLLQEWVAAKFSSRWPIAGDEAASRGLLHRLDRETSGAVLWAGSYAAYYAARLRFAARRARKEYICVCLGLLPALPRLFEQPLLEVSAGGGRAEEARASPRGKPARTELVAASHGLGEAAEGLSLARLRLHTGRLHQIRAHLADAGHSLVGDRVYGDGGGLCRRVFLHAAEAGVAVGGEVLLVASPLPGDLRDTARQLLAMDLRARALLRDCTG